MLQSWRWFGPRDPISLTKIRQAGATGIVTALHDIPAGEVWPKAAIAERKALIEAHGLRWSVVESLPVPSAVRLAEPGHERYGERYQESLANLGELGVKAICSTTSEASSMRGLIATFTLFTSRRLFWCRIQWRILRALS